MYMCCIGRSEGVNADPIYPLSDCFDFQDWNKAYGCSTCSQDPVSSRVKSFEAILNSRELHIRVALPWRLSISDLYISLDP